MSSSLKISTCLTPQCQLPVHPKFRCKGVWACVVAQSKGTVTYSQPYTVNTKAHAVLTCSCTGNMLNARHMTMPPARYNPTLLCSAGP